MQTLVVFNSSKKPQQKVIRAGEIILNGVPVAVGLAQQAPPAFDPESVENRNLVFVEVLAFSCNYRDCGIITAQLLNNTSGTPIHIGSDFVAVVIAVGRNVRLLMNGDRVIGNNSYPVARFRDVLPGVPTNGASRGYLILHESKLIKAPESMSLPVAAGFSIAAQTCYSMIRRLGIRGGERCIVTGASSNTGLFALSRLAQLGVETYALTTGSRDFGSFGVKGTIRVRSGIEESIAANQLVRQLVREHGGADVVVDCFADIYATAVLPLLRLGGKYVTCGVYAQGEKAPQFSPSSTSWRDVLAHLIMNNITIYGNCLGDEADIADAIADHTEHASPIVIDSVLGIESTVAFVSRSFLDPDRFGKVIFQYSEASNFRKTKT